MTAVTAKSLMIKSTLTRRVKAKLAVPGRNRSRDLQKLELLQLRVDAAALQERVRELQCAKEKQVVDHHSLGSLAADNTSLIRRADGMRLDAWQGLAKRQRKLRKDAQSENKYLRELVESQLKTIKTLKRLFRKQTSWKVNSIITCIILVCCYLHNVAVTTETPMLIAAV